MLSYRHSYHAGNFADVLKHIVLVEILEHLIQKDGAFDYFDTHAGAGLYNLKSQNSQKLQEYSQGIKKITIGDFPELSRYFEVVSSFNSKNDITHYPGSPSIANYFLRAQDGAWLYELHPRDYQQLCKTMPRNKQVRVHNHDGFKGLNAILPPKSRRGLVLIDPSYEIKSDYDLVITQIANAHKKFSTGIYALWYPVVNRDVIDKLEKKLLKTGIKHIQRFELGIESDSREKGMTSSGMIVINPPWRLFKTMSILLPKLAAAIGGKDNTNFKHDILAPEG